MRELSPFNFGLLVAYLAPGFVVLWGLSLHSPTVHAWLAVAPDHAPTVGDLFYATLASVACGMIVSAFRWALIDTIHHRTGVAMPAWDFSLLQDRLDGYQLLVEFHYRYYQFFANMLIALAFGYVAFRAAPAGSDAPSTAADIGFGVVCVVLFVTSRDALQKYYCRAGELLTPPERRCVMANGGNKPHHPAPKGAQAKTVEAANQSSDRVSKPTAASKPQAK